MPFSAITNRAEVSKQWKLFAKELKGNSPGMSRVLGWQGGNRPEFVYWHSRHQLWTSVVPQKTGYWCSFGTVDPKGRTGLNIVCEFNVNKSGVDRNRAGVFVQDEAGRVYAAHSGKIGGGHRGVGKTAFVEAYRGDNIEPVQWPDGVETEMIIIGALGRGRLLAEFAHFTAEVERFKKAVQSGQIKKQKTSLPIFSPEFSGTKIFHVKQTIVSQVDHGVVIGALASAIEQRGRKIGSDRYRDLFIMTKQGKLQVLFEAKTDTQLASLYRAVGQLLLNGAASNGTPKLVMVLPGHPKSKTKDVLARLGIRVLTYRWDEDIPRFANLAAFLP